jgi:hypothetical protein
VVSADELAQIMQMINGPLYPQIHAVAERYTKFRLPENNTQSTQTRIASLFRRACKDFLIRDGADSAKQYRADAATLESALQVLRRDGRSYFDSLMSDSRGADRALGALERMAERFREIASDYAKDKKNIVFFYGLGRVFKGLPIPTNPMARDLYAILIEAMRGTVQISSLKTDYDLKDIGRRLKSGHAG